MPDAQEHPGPPRPAAFVLGMLVGVFVLFPAAVSAQSVTLENTEPLTWTGDLSERMLDGWHAFIDDKIDRVVAQRTTRWPRDFSSPAAYEESIRPLRETFRQRIGLIDQRLPASLERFGDRDNPALVAVTSLFKIYRVRWPVFDGVDGEGLLLEPQRSPAGHVIAIGDADHTPEMLAGLAPGLRPESQFARRLAENGFQVVVPVLINRAAQVSGNPAVRMTNQPHREWIYRQAFVMGRHTIGYEVQKILAAVEAFEKEAGTNARIGVAGYGEGGLLALHASAADARIDAALVSGYFESRRLVWEEPLYRNLWGHLREFGDAEIATLIAPRGLVIEHSRGPEIDGPPQAPEGWANAAAPGAIRSPAFSSVSTEFDRIGKLLKPGFQLRRLVAGPEGSPIGPGSEEALRAFAEMLGVTAPLPLSAQAPQDRRKTFDARARQHHQVRQIERHLQALIAASDQVRDQFFLYSAMPALAKQPQSRLLSVETHSAEEFAAAAQRFRTYLWDEIIGRLDDPLVDPQPRSRVIYDRPAWTGHEVVLDVVPGVFAWGILLIPRDLRPGERRPVVVCQHGYNGLPEHTVTGDDLYYRNYAARLAERGFVVFSPHNFYRDTDRFRWLDKKAKTIKLTMFSLLTAQHEQIINWLESLPFVDGHRIGFYGLSYGGTSAMIIPPLLERYALSICSANFNEDIHKLTAVDRGYSYMFHRTWEVPFFNLGNTFGHAEKAYLMIPRPFMVERGHHDGVGIDRWIAGEYAKVRWLYTQLGIPDRSEIEFFNGGHTIRGEGTFDFLHKHLQWPKR